MCCRALCQSDGLLCHRRLVYCLRTVPSLDLIQHTKEALVRKGIGCVTYTGQQDEQENISSFESWRAGG